MIGDGGLVRLLGLLTLASVLAAPAQAQIPGLRLGVHPGMTRAVLDLAEEAPYRVFLAPDARALAVVVPNQREHPRLFSGRAPRRTGIVHAVAIEPDTADETVVMLKLAKAPAAVRAFPMADEAGKPLYRVVVDVADDVGRAAGAAARGRRPRPVAAGASSPAPARRRSSTQGPRSPRQCRWRRRHPGPGLCRRTTTAPFRR